MEAISNRQNSGHRSSKQDDSSKDEGDIVIASAPATTSRKRSVTTESPDTVAKSCSKGDVMSSTMGHQDNPSLIPMTPRVPADFKTQALHSPLLVRHPNRSTSRAEQCEVAFHR